MASINSTGIGSGLDVGSLVSQLVAAERAPASGRILRAEVGTSSKISALASFRGALAGLQTAANALKSGGVLFSKTSSSSNEDIFTLTASAGADAGSYEIEVESLASAHRLRSAGFAAATSVGTGTLSISSGGESIDVDIDIDHSTIGDIRSAINAAAQAQGLGVTATVVNADDGQHLVLSASGTGAAKAIEVTRTGGNGGLDALVYDPGVLESMEELQSAADAAIRIDGLLRTSSSNQISDALDGVTLNLHEADLGNTHTATVSRDDASAKKAIQGFVNSYNTLVAAISTVTRYDASSRQAAALNGDSLVRGAASELRTLLADAIGAGDGSTITPADLGITSQVDGTLKLDSAKLDSAMATKLSAVTDMFSAGDGLSFKLNAAIDRLIGTTGSVTLRTQTLNERLDRLADDRSTLDTRMSRVEARYLAQFTALDSMISKLQSTSSFLSQQLSSLPGAAS
jgi:flagellar hook-associated protein 2